jgi:hypothetical protein
VLLLVLMTAWQPATGVAAQSGRSTAKPPAKPPAKAGAPAAQAAVKSEPAMMMCPEVIGDGVRTRRTYCDVLIGRDPTAGILITLPPHAGVLTLSFDLHNRVTYSEEEIRNKRAYRRFTATIGVLTLDNTLVTRGIVQNEYRSAADLIDRISGGTGPGGLKAVAPTGTETITVSLPADVDKVSILGEKLDVVRADGTPPDNFTVAGRPMALISNAMVQYKPAPPKKAPAAKAPAPKKK